MKRVVTVATLSALGCLVGGALSAGLAQGQPLKTFNLDREHVSDMLIVKFGAEIKAANAVAQIARQGGVVTHTFKSGAMVVSFQGKATGEKALKARAQGLASAKGVQYVEANQILHAFGNVRPEAVRARMPNDARFSELYGMHNDGSNSGTVDADIDAPEAWEVTTGSRNVIVGVIDTGVDYNHPDLAANYWTNPGESGLDASGADKKTNGIDDDGNGYVDDFRGWDFVNNDNDPMDDHSHGTHCSGTIGGHGNDGIGVAGVNWEVSIVGLKFLSGSGSGSLADAVKAIEYGTSLGVTMTSNSWGGGGYSDTMAAAIQAADSAGILFIAAAGNASSNNDATPSYPSSYPSDNVIAVAATDRNDGIASFSSYGATSVDVGAPGVDILSSVLNGGYDTYSGTSMATPHVAGVAALVKSLYPDATAAQIKARILNTVDPAFALAGKTLTGGRVNAFNALENDTIAPNAVSGLAVANTGTTSVDLVWLQAGDDGSVGEARRYDVRYSAAPIDSDAAWNAATRSNVETSTAGGVISARISGLPFNTTGHVAVKAVDNVGNVGAMSDGVAFSVKEVRQVYMNPADTLDGITVEAPWGLQAETDRGNTFADSPTAMYVDDLDVEAVLAPIGVDSSDVTLIFSARWDFEAGYDFGYVEASGDGGVTWTQLDKVTGTSNGWASKTYDLNAALAGSTSLTLRFRVTTDYSIVRDGIQIDDIALFAPMD